MVTTVASGWFWLTAKVAVAEPGETAILPPRITSRAAPVSTAASTSPSSGLTLPRSAMSLMPDEASWPGCQKLTSVLCTPPMRFEKWGFDGNAVGWLSALQVASKRTRYCAVSVAAKRGEATRAATRAKVADEARVMIGFLLEVDQPRRRFSLRRSRYAPTRLTVHHNPPWVNDQAAVEPLSKPSKKRVSARQLPGTTAPLTSISSIHQPLAIPLASVEKRKRS